MLVAAAAIILLSGGRAAEAQSDARRVEAGVQLTGVRLNSFDPLPELLKGEVPIGGGGATWEPGFGGRLTYNFGDNFAVEGVVNWLPREHESVVEGGRKLQGLFGPKVGVRGRRAGLFGKLQPGFMRFGGFPRVIGLSRSSTGVSALQTSRASMFFALDVGGVAETYPSPRTIIRFDVGDTIIRYGGRDPKELNPTFTRHNLQFSVGFGFRF